MAGRPADTSRSDTACDSDSEAEPDSAAGDFPLLLRALRASYAPVGAADAASLACAAGLTETVDALYDAMAGDNARRVLRGSRVAKLLQYYGLPKAQVPRYCSLVDFSNVLCQSFCAKYSLPLTSPRRVTLNEAYDAIRKHSADEAAAIGDRHVQRALSPVHVQQQQQRRERQASLQPRAIGGRPAGWPHDARRQGSVPTAADTILSAGGGGASAHDLLQVVGRQQAEIRHLRQFAAQAVDKMKKLDVQLTAERVARRCASDASADASMCGSVASEPAKSEITVTALRRLRQTLLGLRPAMGRLDHAEAGRPRCASHSQAARRTQAAATDGLGRSRQCDVGSAATLVNGMHNNNDTDDDGWTSDGAADRTIAPDEHFDDDAPSDRNSTAADGSSCPAECDSTPGGSSASSSKGAGGGSECSNANAAAANCSGAEAPAAADHSVAITRQFVVEMEEDTSGTDCERAGTDTSVSVTLTLPRAAQRRNGQVASGQHAAHDEEEEEERRLRQQLSALTSRLHSAESRITRLLHQQH